MAGTIRVDNQAGTNGATAWQRATRSTVPPPVFDVNDPTAIPASAGGFIDYSVPAGTYRVLVGFPSPIPVQTYVGVVVVDGQTTSVALP